MVITFPTECSTSFWVSLCNASSFIFFAIGLILIVSWPYLVWLYCLESCCIVQFQKLLGSNHTLFPRGVCQQKKINEEALSRLIQNEVQSTTLCRESDGRCALMGSKDSHTVRVYSQWDYVKFWHIYVHTVKNHFELNFE